MQLLVAGRTPKDYHLQKQRQTRTDKQSKEEEAAYHSSYISYITRRVRNQLFATFLPVGYPHTVGRNYLAFCGWQFVTNVAVGATGVLSSAFLLYAVGLSGGAAVPTAGAVNWVLKDGVGQLGTLLFGKAIAHNFDIHSKTWYFLSTVLLCAAMGIEIVTAVVPGYFLILGSTANTIKGLSWMAGGSTRSVFNLSFARDNNIADITAKQTSQYILSSVLGTATGVLCTSYIQQSTTAALLCYTVLTWVAMYGAYNTVKRIPLPTLNPTRLQLLAEFYLGNISHYHQMGCSVGPSYFKRGSAPPPNLDSDRTEYVNYQKEYSVFEEDGTGLELPSPYQLAYQDPPLPWLMGDQRILNPSIEVGTNIEKVVNDNPNLLMVLLTTFKYTRYMMLPKEQHIHVILHQEATAKDMVQAYIQACMLRKRLRAGHRVGMHNIAELRIVLHDTLLTAEKLTAPFMAALSRQGWSTEKIVVEAHKSRAHW